MKSRHLAAASGVLLSLALSSTAAAQYSPGSRSLGDRLLPALGNGGYDVQHYDLPIDYDHAAHRTKAARGNGALAPKAGTPNGPSTRHWRESLPLATYLPTATVGDFDYSQALAATALGASGAALQLYNAIDSGHTAVAKSNVL